MDTELENTNDKLDQIVACLNALSWKLDNLSKQIKPDKTILLDANEAANLIGFKKSYIYKMVCYKQIPFIKIGHSLRFDPVELELWIKNQRPEIVKMGLKALENMS